MWLLETKNNLAPPSPSLAAPESASRPTFWPRLRAPRLSRAHSDRRFIPTPPASKAVAPPLPDPAPSGPFRQATPRNIPAPGSPSLPRALPARARGQCRPPGSTGGAGGGGECGPAGCSVGNTRFGALGTGRQRRRGSRFSTCPESPGTALSASGE